jgi:YD repeat-containing protein
MPRGKHFAPSLFVLDRTTQVTLPDGTSHTTYAYSGNTVTVTDPGGRWKMYTSDVFGNVTQVNEPNPAGRRGLRNPVRLQRLRQAHHRDHAAHRSKEGSARKVAYRNPGRPGVSLLSTT